MNTPAKTIESHTAKPSLESLRKRVWDMAKTCGPNDKEFIYALANHAQRWSDFCEDAE